MSKNRKISTQEFDYLKKLKPYITRKKLKEFKSFKYSLMNEIEGIFGDRWYNLKDTTRRAIENICFLSVDRGFFFKSPITIADEFGMSKTTVYDALKVLREEGLLFKANRYSKFHNGLGCAIHFFSIHPYFDQIATYLKVDWNTERKADRKAGSHETPCTTRDFEGNKDSTYSLPTQDLKEKDSHNNVSTQSQKIIKYVPREINKLYADLFDFRLRPIWQKITQAWKSIGDNADRESMIDLGSVVIKRISQIWKEKTRNGSDMDIDEMRAFAYKATRDIFYDTLAREYMAEYDAEENSVLLEVVKTIPAYEDICLHVYPDYDLSSVINHVIGCIDWGFPIISDKALQRIRDNYHKYTKLNCHTTALAQ